MVLLESLFIQMEFGTNSGQFGQGGTLVLPHLTIRPTFPTHTQANLSRSDHFAPRLVSLPRLLKRSKKYRGAYVLTHCADQWVMRSDTHLSFHFTSQGSVISYFYTIVYLDSADYCEYV